MDSAEREQKILDLVVYKYPNAFKTDEQGALVFMPGMSEEEQIQYEEGKFKLLNELDFTSDKEINDAHKIQSFKIAAQDSKNWLFKNPVTDVDQEFWSKAIWYLNEAIIISLGKDPRRIDAKYFDRCCASNVRNLKNEQIFLRYTDLLALVTRANEAGQLIDPVPPLKFIQWADQLDIDFPKEITARILRYHNYQDFKALYEQERLANRQLTEKKNNLLQIQKDKIKKLQSKNSGLKNRLKKAQEMFLASYLAYCNKNKNSNLLVNNVEDIAKIDAKNLQTHIINGGSNADTKTIREHIDVYLGKDVPDDNDEEQAEAKTSNE